METKNNIEERLSPFLEDNFDDSSLKNLSKKVEDRYNRPIISLRLSITNRCNINCLYCHHDGMMPSNNEMTSDEIFQILKIAKTLGVEKIRFSGGEPLIRKDIVEIIEKTASLNFKDISITTNGILLAKYAEDLFNAGLTRVNVSFDTLDSETYKKITTKNYLKEAKKGVLKAVEVGLNPVKLNMVVMKNINDNEVMEMFEFAKDNGLVLQLIELMKSENCDDNAFSEEYHFDVSLIEKKLAKLAKKVRTRKFMQDRKKYFIDDGEIEVVRPMDNTKFCENCTRLRITPEGKIKPCLLRNDNLIDIITPLREGASEDSLRKIFLEGISNREPYYINDNE
ncbi:GTP 3',8-cyclase MoaA [Methanobrevibacter arboriphilus]|jgi:cyclic pyranopterin phosphate synthase|uniref:GTP 3',8-cyclase MoaA n=1 Tax=Methanobrevibacter arboriphilus TaxID=39441 RepID=A0ACA8R4C5_METAZ|nr:GTP 3',8-cyclase MoaA [Methanobrevibacter arboriphilus]BBL62319.1 GTP 3',8-cyclase MoaA [Methanobrevibacter arboriphilus]